MNWTKALEGTFAFLIRYAGAGASQRMIRAGYIPKLVDAGINPGKLPKILGIDGWEMVRMALSEAKNVVDRLPDGSWYSVLVDTMVGEGEDVFEAIELCARNGIDLTPQTQKGPAKKKNKKGVPAPRDPEVERARAELLLTLITADDENVMRDVFTLIGRIKSPANQDRLVVYLAGLDEPSLRRVVGDKVVEDTLLLFLQIDPDEEEEEEDDSNEEPKKNGLDSEAIVQKTSSWLQKAKDDLKNQW